MGVIRHGESVVMHGKNGTVEVSKGMALLLGAAGAGSDDDILRDKIQQAFNENAVNSCNMKLMSSMFSISGSVTEAVRAISSYCDENRERPFISMSKTGLQWADASKSNYQYIDEILTYTKITEDWVPYADKSIIQLLQTLKEITERYHISAESMFDFGRQQSGMWVMEWDGDTK